MKGKFFNCSTVANSYNTYMKKYKFDTLIT